MLPWLVSYAAGQITRGQIGAVGLTPHQRLKGRAFRKLLPVLAESVLCLSICKRASRLPERWSDGLFLRVVEKSSEFDVGTVLFVVRCRSLRRRPLETRANVEFLDKLVGVPWQQVLGDLDSSAVPTVTSAEPIAEGDDLPGRADAIPSAARTYLRKKHRAETTRPHWWMPWMRCGALEHGCQASRGCTPCRVEEAMTGDEIGRARLAETLLRRDKRREPDDLEIEAPGVRRRVEGGASSSSGHTATAPESVPVAMPVDVPYVVDMAADMDIEALLEKQVEELGMLMTALGQTETHVAEIFSPGRFTVRARCFDLRSGTAMDLRTGYDFNREADRLRARESQKDEKPLLLVGSPRCAAFSQLQNLARDSERWRALAREGMQLLIFVCELYKKQIDGERSFLHEHPAQPGSWGLWMICEVLDKPGVVRVVGSQAHRMDDKLIESGTKRWTADALEDIGIATFSLVVRTRCVSLSATPFGS